VTKIDRRRFIAALLSSVAVLRLPTTGAAAVLPPPAVPTPAVPGFGPPWGVHEALQAYADGLITARDALKILDLQHVAELRQAAKSSGVVDPLVEEETQ
jgi:hypothetical protein